MSPRFNIATLLTWFRIAAIPLIMFFFFLPPAQWMRPVTSMIFTVAALTDWLDGYLARRLNQTSRFGAFLDPVADKLMVTTTLVLIVQSNPTISNTLIAAIIIGRELTVSALREWMAELGARNVVAVSGFGKIKTIMQMFGLGFMLWKYPTFGIPIYSLGLLMLLIAAGLTLWSMFAYIRAAWPSLRGADEVS